MGQFICGVLNDVRRFDCVALNMRIIVHSEFESRWKNVSWPQFNLLAPELFFYFSTPCI